MVAVDQAAAAAAAGAAAAAVDQRLPREREASVKAAAWAWYQRSGGSIAPAAGRSEAFASRCTARLSPSRFLREAAMRSRMLDSAQGSDVSTLTRSSSSMGKLSGSSFSLSSSTATPGGASDQADDPTCLWNPDQDSADQPQPSLELISMDPAACWDCGSSLFDSFELIAMSRKLDAAELDEPNFDAQQPEGLPPASPDSHLKEPQVLSLCDAPQDAVSPPSSPPRAPHQETHSTLDIFDKLISASDKQSKRAVYDMFCHYGDAAKHVTKQSCKRSQPADASCGGASRKHKLRPGRLSFHGFAKALHSFAHLQLHASSGGGGRSDGSEAVQDHHHHHYLQHSPNPQPSMTGKASYAQGQALITPSGDHYVHDDVTDGSQSKARHIHHHHHHHYHYLFHSDDDFPLQPLDKSLVVAAAGLRASKVSPALSSYLDSPARAEFPLDFGRKWAEFGSIPPPNFQY